MPLLFGHDQDVAAWAENKLEGRLVFPHAAVGMLDKRGVLRGAWLLSFHNAHTAELTLYSEGVVTNGMIGDLFRFTFDHLQVNRLQIRTTRKNKAIKRAAPKYGFRFEGVQKHFYGPNQDALCYFMTPDICRWIQSDDRAGRTVQAA